MIPGWNDVETDGRNIFRFSHPGKRVRPLYWVSESIEIQMQISYKTFVGHRIESYIFSFLAPFRWWQPWGKIFPKKRSTKWSVKQIWTGMAKSATRNSQQWWVTKELHRYPPCMYTFCKTMQRKKGKEERKKWPLMDCNYILFLDATIALNGREDEHNQRCLLTEKEECYYFVVCHSSI